MIHAAILPSTAVYPVSCITEAESRKEKWPQKEKTLLLLSALLLTTSVIFRKSLNSFNPFEPQCAHLNNSNKSVCEEEEEERRVLPWVVPKPSSSFHVYQYYYPPNDSEK